MANYDVSTVLNAALQMAIGDSTIDKLATYDFIDGGAVFSNFSLTKEQFTQALMNVKIKDFLTDGKYDEAYRDPFYKDAAKYGSITQLIHVGLPQIRSARSWTDFSGGNVSVGAYTVAPSSISTKMVQAQNSFSCEVWITGEQWNTAFRSEDELSAFVTGIFVSMENSITAHLEVLSELARNTFIARKFQAQADALIDGIHTVNLVQSYVDEVLGGDSALSEDLTVETFLNDKDMLIFGASKILEYVGYMYKMSVLFNTEGFERFVPRERLVVQVLDYFEKRFNSVARSSTFHDELIALPAYQNIASWQALDGGLSAPALSFDALSSIDIQLDAATPTPTVINQSGIVALLADNWCIGTTVFSRRGYNKQFTPEDLTLYGQDCIQKIFTNTGMNAVVFYLEDVEKPEDPGE